MGGFFLNLGVGRDGGGWGVAGGVGMWDWGVECFGKESWGFENAGVR